MPSPRTAEALASAVGSRLVPGLVAGVFSSRKQLFSVASGASVLDPHAPMRLDTVFRVASMTKLVTSVAVMMLADEGLVELDATVATYVPGFRQPEVLQSFDPSTGAYTTRPARRDATLRELLSHTGGYGYWFLDESLRIASGAKPNLVDPPFLTTDPGTRFSYSSSHDVAGLVIEPVAGVPLDEFFARRIFAPLGMVDTTFVPPADRARLVPLARRNDNGFEQIENELEGQAPRGGGGLYSTLADYALLLQCLLRGGEPLLGRAAAAELGRNQIGALTALRPKTAFADRTNDFIFMDDTQKFGLGVMIETRDRPDGRPRGSFGWAGIFNTYFWVDGQNDIVAILLMQLQPFSDPGCIEVLSRFERAVYRDLRTGAFS